MCRKIEYVAEVKEGGNEQYLTSSAPGQQLIAMAGGERIELAPGVVLRTYPALHALMPFDRENDRGAHQS